MSAVYSIFTSPHHPPVPSHLPTLIVTPHGRPSQILYTYLHTNTNTENYLLTPSPEGDLCVAKLFPPDATGSLRLGAANAAAASGAAAHVRCEAGRGLAWKIAQTGIQNPVYKVLLPNPDLPGDDQPLFQVSKPNPNAPWWSLFYFAYAGHLIPPRRIEFGRISKNAPEQGGGTRVAITGGTEEEKAVWASLGPGNEDAVEWLVVCAALTVLDDEIVATSAGPAAAGLVPPPAHGGKTSPSGSPRRARTPGLSSQQASPMRVVPAMEMQTHVPRSASGSSLAHVASGGLAYPVAKEPSPAQQIQMQQQQRASRPSSAGPPVQQQQQPDYQQQQPREPYSQPPPPRQQSAPPPPEQQSYQRPQEQRQQREQHSQPPPPRQQSMPSAQEQEYYAASKEQQLQQHQQPYPPRQLPPPIPPQAVQPPPAQSQPYPQQYQQQQPTYQQGYPPASYNGYPDPRAVPPPHPSSSSRPSSHGGYVPPPRSSSHPSLQQPQPQHPPRGLVPPSSSSRPPSSSRTPPAPSSSRPPSSSSRPRTAPPVAAAAAPSPSKDKDEKKKTGTARLFSAFRNSPAPQDYFPAPPSEVQAQEGRAPPPPQQQQQQPSREKREHRQKEQAGARGGAAGDAAAFMLQPDPHSHGHEYGNGQTYGAGMQPPPSLAMYDSSRPLSSGSGTSSGAGGGGGKKLFKSRR
ncbi:uncharacterized protein JCM10292_005294 [Rhodotorula paludigena]|uniref:uncharacterized protein n=1 Tax=Rhodotorula paludigena TaxID=86838 RepID=UPI00316E5683